MRYYARRTVSFDAHHRFDDDTREPEENPHARDHGHRFTVEVTYEVSGDPSTSSWDIDVVGDGIDSIVGELDNRSVNEMAPVHPSISGLARYLTERFAMLLPDRLISVEVSDGSGDTASVERQG